MKTMKTKGATSASTNLKIFKKWTRICLTDGIEKLIIKFTTGGEIVQQNTSHNWSFETFRGKEENTRAQSHSQHKAELYNTC